jgi:hypothetical protein
VTLGMLVGKAVNNTVFGVKAVCNQVEILRITCVVAAEYGVSDVVSNLHKARCPRVDEKRCVGYISENAPFCTDLAETHG